MMLSDVSAETDAGSGATGTHLATLAQLPSSVDHWAREVEETFQSPLDQAILQAEVSQWLARPLLERLEGT